MAKAKDLEAIKACCHFMARWSPSCWDLVLLDVWHLAIAADQGLDQRLGSPKSYV